MGQAMRTQLQDRDARQRQEAQMAKKIKGSHPVTKGEKTTLVPHVKSSIGAYSEPPLVGILRMAEAIWAESKIPTLQRAAVP